ncbi:hypothetical protein PP7435_CHR4-0729 [Komagataella phaffii CBS 7435]|uniref:Uncharacterized protein n=2 Tax=Komagataella phaffii TaxID=460519 RepID=C4R7D2_KOMPG|nr:Hypothetical protein PAS_chr4_0273 [Komagataella phaffii GS115]AOA64411.1 GQ67_04600T0 [Komagataella phaffii]CAH2451121.1 hypothetical protein BQ9382_C4-3850 [Komagataella phaffii CBS 7435]AOA70095.1 GQ68_04572T0 [Komagataella phaffii GS115]CAY71507.1 Hypothetical protein PAS_chr4_0273 [Komagataella phaffii GS115]CCA40885.1 hypothetical protein PP7435_CHR4-0729 [Komagataella phaffii CBS 7435]
MFSHGNYLTPNEFKQKARSQVLQQFGNNISFVRAPPVSSASSLRSEVYSRASNSSYVFNDQKSLESSNSLDTHHYYNNISLPPLRPSLRHFMISRVLEDLSQEISFSNNIDNLGLLVYSQLNSLNLTDVLDWKLNTVRCLLLLSEIPHCWANKMDHHSIPPIRLSSSHASKDTVIPEIYKSEIIKVQEKTPHTQFSRIVRRKIQGDLDSPVFELKLLPPNPTDSEFVDFLVHSNLYKEFKLESSFKRQVAMVSVSKARKLQTETEHSDPDESLGLIYLAIGLQNYFLNILVASLTLFEFHYAVCEILTKERKLSKAEHETLWNNIREKNYAKISKLW